MPSITRQGDNSTGHDSCPPVALSGGSGNVSADGKPVGRVGDSYASHGCENHPAHQGAIASGSGTVYVNGISVGRIGDTVSCGGNVAQGSGDVYVGG